MPPTVSRLDYAWLYNSVPDGFTIVRDRKVAARLLDPLLRNASMTGYRAAQYRVAWRALLDFMHPTTGLIYITQRLVADTAGLPDGLMTHFFAFCRDSELIVRINGTRSGYLVVAPEYSG